MGPKKTIQANSCHEVSYSGPSSEREPYCHNLSEKEGRKKTLVACEEVEKRS